MVEWREEGMVNETLRLRRSSWREVWNIIISDNDNNDDTTISDIIDNNGERDVKAAEELLKRGLNFVNDDNYSDNIKVLLKRELKVLNNRRQQHFWSNCTIIIQDL